MNTALEKTKNAIDAINEMVYSAMRIFFAYWETRGCPTG